MPLPGDCPQWTVQRSFRPVTGEAWPWSVAITGVTAVHYRCRPQWQVARRTVADEMLWAGLAGSGWIEIGGQRRALARGRLIHVDRGRLHAAGCGGEGLEVICVHYAAEVAGVPLAALVRPPIAAERPLDGPLYASLHELCRWHARGGALAAPAMAGAMAGILAELMAHAAAERRPDDDLRRLLPALTAMQDRLHLAPRMAALAAACGLSPAQFSRIFRASLGTSPHAHLARLRLDAARALLRAGVPIAAVADRVGYREPASFTRAFRAATGLSPSRWRDAGDAGP